MVDLPDYYTQSQISEAEAAMFKGGLDANKSATPVSRDIYLATDTHKLYVCFTDGTWTGFDASILTQGILTLYADMAGGGFEIKNIKDPTAAQSAATRAYVDANPGLAAFLDHSARHEDTGADEISIEGLAGSPAQKAAASGLASLNASSKVVQDPATSYLLSTEKAAASGVASLNASSKVVQDPATVFAQAALGSYTGNSSVNRAIPHGLGITAKIVLILIGDTPWLFHIFSGSGAILYGVTGVYAVTNIDGTNFYVGNAMSYANSANLDGYAYRWVAIG